MEKLLWLIRRVKGGLRGFGQIILSCGAVSCIGRYLAAPLASTHQKSIAGDSRHSQNIQINKVIGESEKRVFYFMEKTPKDFLANPITSFVLIWEIRGLA